MEKRLISFEELYRLLGNHICRIECDNECVKTDISTCPIWNTLERLPEPETEPKMVVCEMKQKNVCTLEGCGHDVKHSGCDELYPYEGFCPSKCVEVPQ